MKQAIRLLTVLLSTLSAIAGAQQGPPTPVLSASPQAASPAQITPQSAPVSGVPAAPGGSVTIAPPANGVSSSYIIGPEDMLQINVWKEPALSGNVPVRPDGMVSLPLMGDINASGLTPMALSAQISARLKKYVNDPNVTVTVAAVHLKQIFLLGEVVHVGALTLLDGMTPLQAISASGGVSPYANTKKIYILRGEPGKQEKLPFNYKIALKTGDQQGISLLPGDTIVIP